jgi:hypothetical protein
MSRTRATLSGIAAATERSHEARVQALPAKTFDRDCRALLQGCAGLSEAVIATPTQPHLCVVRRGSAGSMSLRAIRSLCLSGTPRHRIFG